MFPNSLNDWAAPMLAPRFEAELTEPTRAWLLVQTIPMPIPAPITMQVRIAPEANGIAITPPAAKSNPAAVTPAVAPQPR